MGEHLSWLMQTLTGIIKSKPPTMKEHKCVFRDDAKAAETNAKWLHYYKWDLEEAIRRQRGTMVYPGSEFRSVEVIEELWRRHEHWPKMKDIIRDGDNYPLENLTEAEREGDLKHMIRRGNHLSARKPKENYETLRENYRKEVKKGWMLPLPIKCLTKVRGAAVIPVGVHTQFTIDEAGKRKIKRRTTHDASFPPPSNKSVNQIMDREALQECFYGHCLLRVLNRIHSMRVRHPLLQILLIKIDLDAAYIRLHVRAKMALLMITIIDAIAYVLLRLPFGVANGPNDYLLISEPLFDLTNYIMEDPTFDPKTL